MVIVDVYDIPIYASLGVIVGALTIAIGASILRPLPEPVEPPAA
jgi:hypothetical protein